jgi:hypothetical protein
VPIHDEPPLASITVVICETGKKDGLGAGWLIQIKPSRQLARASDRESSVTHCRHRGRFAYWIDLGSPLIRTLIWISFIAEQACTFEYEAPPFRPWRAHKSVRELTGQVG